MNDFVSAGIRLRKNKKNDSDTKTITEKKNAPFNYKQEIAVSSTSWPRRIILSLDAWINFSKPGIH